MEHLAGIQSTQRGFYKVLQTFHERGQPLSVAALSEQSTLRCNQLNCPLIWAILKPWGAVAVVRGEKHGGLPVDRVTRYQ